MKLLAIVSTWSNAVDQFQWDILLMTARQKQKLILTTLLNRNPNIPECLYDLNMNIDDDLLVKSIVGSVNVNSTDKQEDDPGGVHM